MNEEEVSALSSLLCEFSDVFAKNDQDIGCFTGVTHRIDMEDAKPIKQRLRRVPIGFQEEEQKHLKQMLDSGIIRPSNSDWAAAPVLVRKKDGGVHWWVDYHALNNRTVKDAYPLPLIEECLDVLGGNTFYLSLDMVFSYWQIPIEPSIVISPSFLTGY